MITLCSSQTQLYSRLSHRIEHIDDKGESRYRTQEEKENYLDLQLEKSSMYKSRKLMTFYDEWFDFVDPLDIKNNYIAESTVNFETWHIHPYSREKSIELLSK